MFKADVFCPILVLVFLAACAGSERTVHLPTALPDADVSEIDCNWRHEQGVYVTAAQFAKHSWARAKKFSEVQSTLARPVEVCGVSQELEFLTRLRCNDGSNPYPSRRAAHLSRRGSRPAGRCGSPIDTYDVPCPEAHYRVHLDMYICPERDVHDVAWERYMTAGSGAARQGNYAEAERQFSLARTEAEARDPLGPHMTGTLSSQAFLHRTQGEYTEAESLFRQTLAIQESVLGSEHPDLARSLGGLAFVYQDQGRYSEAEPLYKRVLAINEKAFGLGDPRTATSLSNLAGLYKAMGHYDEAEPLHRQALAIDEETLGPNDLAVSSNLRDLAGLSQAQGKHAEAESLSKRALAIRETVQGSRGALVGSSLRDLAWLYAAQGRYAEAESLYKRALAIAEEPLHPDSAGVGEILDNLADLYRAEGRYAEAEPLYQRALAIREKELGPQHPFVATSLEHYVALLRATDRSDKADALAARAEAIRAVHAATRSLE